MRRIRTIKPEFPQDEKIGALSRDQRLLFVLLWTIADDSGKFRAHPALIRAECYPYDGLTDADVSEWMAALREAGMIELYECKGQHYGKVVNWLKHQRVDHPSKSRLPPSPSEEPREDSRESREDAGTVSGNLASDLGSRIGSGPRPRDDQEGRGSGGGKSAAPAGLSPSGPPVAAQAGGDDPLIQAVRRKAAIEGAKAIGRQNGRP